MGYFSCNFVAIGLNEADFSIAELYKLVILFNEVGIYVCMYKRSR